MVARQSSGDLLELEEARSALPILRLSEEIYSAIRASRASDGPFEVRYSPACR
ncbi:MAG: hypothetical protein HYV07_30490 [Deltaproteobacteria bacterium]|nr:hypothetical protein [Deltaproteobacteria bacterium]